MWCLVRYSFVTTPQNESMCFFAKQSLRGLERRLSTPKNTPGRETPRVRFMHTHMVGGS